MTIPSLWRIRTQEDDDRYVEEVDAARGSRVPRGPRLRRLRSHQLHRRWNNAKYELQQVQAKLADAKAMRDAAEKDAARSREALEKRAVDAYTGMGSDLDVLLGIFYGVAIGLALSAVRSGPDDSVS